MGCFSLQARLLHKVGACHQLAPGAFPFFPEAIPLSAHPAKPARFPSRLSTSRALPFLPMLAPAPRAAKPCPGGFHTNFLIKDPGAPFPHSRCSPQYATPLCSPACEQPLRLGFIFLTHWPLHSHQVKLQPNKKENRGRERKKERPQEAPGRSNQVTVSIPIRTDAKHIIKNRSADPSMLIIVLRFRPQPTPLINKETAREGGGERVAGIPLTGASCSESSREKLDT